jgi:hypothetical protein
MPEPQENGTDSSIDRAEPCGSVWSRPSVRLGISGLVALSWYAVIAWWSRDFSYGSPGVDRPLLSVMSVLGAAFALYLGQVAFVLRWSGNRTLGQQHKQRHDKAEGVLSVIIVFAVAFRVLLLFSEPIQEVDAYRYLWDGQVVASGVNPYRYSPEQVQSAQQTDELPSDLWRLTEVRDAFPARATILNCVHFGELTTVYPPVSLAVFALAASVTPDSASVTTHLLVMKSFIVVFDLATLWIMILLLRCAGRPAEWSIAYAWCPLVLKEFANSGHLDSIAVFVATAALYCAVRGLFADELPAGRARRMSPASWLVASSLLLGLGVGAKIYPAIFAPLLLLSAWRRVSFRTAVIGGVIFTSVSAAMILPMLARDHGPAAGHTVIEQSDSGSSGGYEGDGDSVISSVSESSTSPPLPNEPQLLTVADFELSSLPLPGPPLPGPSPLPGPPVPVPSGPPVPGVSASGSLVDSADTGLGAFATQWQMNDFLFLLLFENLRPDYSRHDSQLAWFVVTTPDRRTAFVTQVADVTGISARRVPFLVTRLIATAVFAGLALWWGWRGAGSTDPAVWLEAAFLTVAWFWLLQPTQNPWYWTWALPLVAFARSRLWLLLSGLTLLYYLRFWCLYHAASTPLFGTRYAGTDFFDFVGSWLEFAPWLLALFVEACRRRA